MIGVSERLGNDVFYGLGRIRCRLAKDAVHNGALPNDRNHGASEARPRALLGTVDFLVGNSPCFSPHELPEVIIAAKPRAEDVYPVVVHLSYQPVQFVGVALRRQLVHVLDQFTIRMTDAHVHLPVVELDHVETDHAGDEEGSHDGCDYDFHHSVPNE